MDDVDDAGTIPNVTTRTTSMELVGDLLRFRASSRGRMDVEVQQSQRQALHVGSE
jgi:hypothetical protein